MAWISVNNTEMDILAKMPEFKHNFNLQEALREREKPSDYNEEKRDAAIEAYARDGEIEVDADAVVSESDDNGAYVMAWLWVGDDPLEAGDLFIVGPTGVEEADTLYQVCEASTDGHPDELYQADDYEVVASFDSLEEAEAHCATQGQEEVPLI